MSKNNYKGNIQNLIKKYITENPNIDKAKMLARIILKAEPVKYNIEHLSVLIRKFKKDNNIIPSININTNDTNDEKYVIENNNYTWISSTLGNIKLSIDLANQLFYEYSRHGLDLSQIAIRQKHNITIQYWHAIKSALWLYKDSNIFSPHTVNNTPDDMLQDMIADKMKMKFNDKNRLIESEYNKALQHQYKKSIQNESIKTFAIEKMIDEIYDITKHQTKTKVININIKPEPYIINDLIITLADLHIGAQTNNLKITPEFNSNILKNRLTDIAEQINNKNAKRVHLMFLGDLIETFTGLNHINSWQSIENGMHGAKVIILAIELIEGFINQINNIHNILAISGNHDRISSNNKEDVNGQAAEIIFYMINKMYKQYFNVTYDSLIISKTIDNINYIITHGDKKVVKQDGKQAIIDYGDSTKFNMIITGHLHTRLIKEDQKSYRWIVAPSLFTGNTYSEQNGWSSSPGVLFIHNKNNKPIIEDITLN